MPNAHNAPVGALHSVAVNGVAVHVTEHLRSSPAAVAAAIPAYWRELHLGGDLVPGSTPGHFDIRPYPRALMRVSGNADIAAEPGGTSITVDLQLPDMPKIPFADRPMADGIRKGLRGLDDYIREINALEVA